MRLCSEAILLIRNQEKGSIRIMLKLSCWLSSVASQLYGMGSLVLQYCRIKPVLGVLRFRTTCRT